MPPIRLSELKAYFVKYEVVPCKGYGIDPECHTVSEHTTHTVYSPVDTIDEADGLFELCPKCFLANGRNEKGTHWLLHWRIGRVADDVNPGPGRWNFLGTGIEDITFQAGSSSIGVGENNHAHFFIRNGQVEDLT